MCGIAGILNFNNKPLCLKSLVKMTEIVKHRGPDGQGIVLFDPNVRSGQAGTKEYLPAEFNQYSQQVFDSAFSIGFGHTRLSIIDLSKRGHQPMCNDDESLWIVHNGEIYNYLEIKAELIAKGYKFKSDTDTEVLLYSYQEWGEDCLHKFNGMWAFAIWDRKNKSLFCSRDRFGVKPFYYYLKDNIFIFASEIKQILECSEYNREPNDLVIYDYLTIGLENHTDQTFFKGIFELKGGECATLDLDNNTFKKKRFYDLNKISSIREPDRESDSESYDRFKELFIDSVKLRLRSDVPIGSSLSGGLDSSAVVSVGSSLQKNDTFFNTFTACWADEKIDEKKYAKVVVGSSDAKANYIYPSPEELKQDLSRLIWHQEEPFGSLSIFAQWSVMKAAKNKEIPVLLDGQGGDEVFLGYERYFSWFLLELIKKLKLRKFFHEVNCIAKNSKLTRMEIILFYIYFNFNDVRSFRLKKKAKHFLNVSFIKSVNMKKRLNVFKSVKSVIDLQILEIQQLQLAHLLRYSDKNSMAFSIECRLPFLDYRLVEFALGQSSEKKIRDGWTKNIVREGLKGLIPEKIRKRKNKLGFEVPQDSLMQAILPQMVKKLEKGTMIEKYFNMDLLLNTLKSENINELITWKAICLDLWFDEFFK